MNIEQEFEELKKRFKKADEYFRTKYVTDTPEEQKRIEVEYKKLIDRMSEIYNQNKDLDISDL